MRGSGGGGPPRAAIKRGGKNMGDKGDIRHLTTFEGGKIAVRPGCR